MITIQVRFFAAAAEAAKTPEAEFQLTPPARLGDLIELLEARHPRLAQAGGRLTFAVNQAYATPDRELADGDVVAVIPPVSGGGTDRVELIDCPIDVGAVVEAVMGDPANGAINLFVGTTRTETHPRHGQLSRLEYQAYREMARKEIEALVAEARRRWAVGRVAVVHRVGAVALGQPSVAIAVACPHREESFQVCRFLIDRLKQTVPIWKQEVWDSRERTWVRGTAPEPGG